MLRCGCEVAPEDQVAVLEVMGELLDAVEHRAPCAVEAAREAPLAEDADEEIVDLTEDDSGAPRDTIDLTTARDDDDDDDVVFVAPAVPEAAGAGRRRAVSEASATARKRAVSEVIDLASEVIDLTNDDDDDEYVTFFCLLYTSPSPRDRTRCRMPSSA